MFLCAPVYMLMVSRIGKRFVTLIYMTILGVIFLLMGNWFLLPYYVLVGLLCEAILWKEGSCQKPKRLTAAWTAASLLYNGVNLLPIWFFWDTYYDFALASGMEQSYIDSYVRYYTSHGWLAFILLFTTLMGFLGCMVGSRLIRRHFSEGRRPMRADASFAVPVKLWALLCVFAGVTIGGNVLLTCILTGGALLYLVLQRNFRLAASYGCFYLLLALLLYGIRFHGLRMPVFSEFYVLMFWNLSPIFLVSWDLITTPPGMLSAFLSRLRMPTPFILGLLVVFRFFPTMRTELKGVGRSMKNRGLTAAGQLLAHPVQSMEYVLVPFLLRVLQLADQLSVSAVARGAERPGVRGSYYEKRIGARDHIAAAACAIVTASYLVLERSMA